MPPPRAIVGVSIGAPTPERLTRQAPLRRALRDAGMVPVLLRPDEGVSALERVQALVLGGGGDINPARYGRPLEPDTRWIDDERDAFEIEVARAAIDGGMPVLGVCRGMQVMVVALGGTLHQHVLGFRDALAHDTEGYRHIVRLVPDARLASVFGGQEVDTNSSHHQAPDDVPPSLRCVATTEDGVIEAVEAVQAGAFTAGVQWHPERDPTPASERLFRVFADEAAAQRAIRRI